MTKLNESLRICIMIRNSQKEQYGCDVMTHNGEHLIVSIIPGSIAERSGLKRVHRIVAVNGINVLELAQTQVSYLILSNPLKCELLVIDPSFSTHKNPEWDRIVSELDSPALICLHSPYMLSSNNNGMEMIEKAVNKIFSMPTKSYSRVGEEEVRE
ncbi:unnamed protein product, partial [Mesorhabditis belari]|uniref:PDZ domain-containing protein n=1 Tax=Mesorhabditis belari TaxID=2138241 RepID=A0AAF3FCU4_9BILA